MFSLLRLGEGQVKMPDEDDLCMVVKVALAELRERVKAELQAQHSSIRDDGAAGDKEHPLCIGDANTKNVSQCSSVPAWMLPEGVEAEVMGSWVSHTLASLLQEIVRESLQDAPQPPNEQSVVVVSALLDHTWQRLNTGA